MMKKIRLAAHRGFSKLYPENTLVAFKAALETDITMVETDVHMTADKQLILLHDNTLNRTTDGSGRAIDLTYKQILAFDAGIKKNEKFKGERVPHLEDFLTLMQERPNIEMNIELKDYPLHIGDAAYESCDRVINMLIDAGLSKRVYINSFSSEILQYIHKTYGGRFRLHGYYPSYIMGKDVPDTIYDILFCVCLFNTYLDENGHIQHHTDPVCKQSAFDEILRRGIEPWVYYPVDKEYDLMRAVQRGAVAITSNDPVTAREILTRNGIK